MICKYFLPSHGCFLTLLIVLFDAKNSC
jgi:hypothetical protein